MFYREPFRFCGRHKQKMKIQRLAHADLHLITDLQPSGWQNIMPSIEFYTTSNFCFPIKVIANDKIVGIGTTIIHNDVAWLAHIIVHPEHRNQGIGKLITATLVESLKAKNCHTIYLIATDLGEPVYKKVGFETETEYLFFKDVNIMEPFPISDKIVPFCEDFKQQAINLDFEVSKENRAFYLEEHLSSGFVYLANKRVEGLYLPTFGEGLIIAATDLAGQELMKLRLTAKENAVFPIDNTFAKEFMYLNNFKEFRTAKRMRLGKSRSWQPSNIYNRIGGNLG